jgi:hypothetical protein
MFLIKINHEPQTRQACLHLKRKSWGRRDGPLMAQSARCQVMLLPNNGWVSLLASTSLSLVSCRARIANSWIYKPRSCRKIRHNFQTS